MGIVNAKFKRVTFNDATRCHSDVTPPQLTVALNSNIILSLVTVTVVKCYGNVSSWVDRKMSSHTLIIQHPALSGEADSCKPPDLPQVVVEMLNGDTAGLKASVPMSPILLDLCKGTPMHTVLYLPFSVWDEIVQHGMAAGSSRYWYAYRQCRLSYTVIDSLALE